MNNIFEYKEYVNEMVILNKPSESKDPIDGIKFTEKEIRILQNNEAYPFDLIDKTKAVCLISDLYKISIYKKKNDEYFSRIRDIRKSFNPVIFETTTTNLIDCLYILDDFMWEKIKIENEKSILAKKLEKERLEREARGDKEYKNNHVFPYKSFSGKWNM